MGLHGDPLSLAFRYFSIRAHDGDKRVEREWAGLNCSFQGNFLTCGSDFVRGLRLLPKRILRMKYFCDRQSTSLQLPRRLFSAQSLTDHRTGSMLIRIQPIIQHNSHCTNNEQSADDEWPFPK